MRAKNITSAFPPKPPPRRRSRPRRLFALVRARCRRLHRRSVARLVLFSGWTWVAAGSFVGFEMLEIIFGAFILAPELLPIVLIVLASAWYFRARLRRSWTYARARMRLARLRRRLR